ncbi:alkaline serine protease [Vibrio azureus]|uniref:Alkaline serine protease n=1 Tax=Vibrio azureus NBRC 104587 TaxID=1219077 RepID=U3A4P5_9VIBR|nr:S8 family peptidase [Vibrio azureus]AUI88134.1 alkaline serine protease [Vibrio azureus]GAD74971.1 hypothetical protein VAZ01S_017_00670 [Vibrio azureus NBRC 104587]
MLKISIIGGLTAITLTYANAGFTQHFDGTKEDKAPLLLAPASSGIPGQYIVSLKLPGVIESNSIELKQFTHQVINDVAQDLSINIEQIFDHSMGGFVARLDTHQLNVLRMDPRIDFIEQDKVIELGPILSPSLLQDDAVWGLDRIDQRDLPLDSQYTTQYDGTGVTAYVIDTGINNEHEEFSGRSISGYDAVDKDNDTSDCHGHGTHVAGTIGGAQYGVAKNIQLVGVRVLSCSGSGSTSGVIAGVDWVTGHASGPSVANMSLGGGKSLALDNAVEKSIESGISYMLAAGNENADACNGSPARVEPGVTVGSTTRNDSRSSFSNWGSCVDMFAPGSGIKSAWFDGGYRTISGTSMATPHVAGVAALYLQEDETLLPAQVSERLIARASDNKVSDNRNTANKLLYSLSDDACKVDCNKPTPTPSPDQQLLSGVPIHNLSAPKGEQQFFYVDLVKGTTLNVLMIGGNGDADMYLKFGDKPTKQTWDCRPYKLGNRETCTINNSETGRYHIMLNAYSDYSGVSLQADF